MVPGGVDGATRWGRGACNIAPRSSNSLWAGGGRGKATARGWASPRTARHSETGGGAASAAVWRTHPVRRTAGGPVAPGTRQRCTVRAASSAVRCPPMVVYTSRSQGPRRGRRGPLGAAPTSSSGRPARRGHRIRRIRRCARHGADVRVPGPSPSAECMDPRDPRASMDRVGHHRTAVGVAPGSIQSVGSRSLTTASDRSASHLNDSGYGADGGRVRGRTRGGDATPSGPRAAAVGGAHSGHRRNKPPPRRAPRPTQPRPPPRSRRTRRGPVRRGPGDASAPCDHASAQRVPEIGRPC